MMYINGLIQLSLAIMAFVTIGRVGTPEMNSLDQQHQQHPAYVDTRDPRIDRLGRVATYIAHCRVYYQPCTEWHVSDGKMIGMRE